MGTAAVRFIRRHIKSDYVPFKMQQEASLYDTPPFSTPNPKPAPTVYTGAPHMMSWHHKVKSSSHDEMSSHEEMVSRDEMASLGGDGIA